MSYTTEVIRRVYDDQEGVSVQIGPDPDCDDWVCISTPDKKSQEFFGALRLSISKEMAKQIAQALLEASK